MVCRKCYFHLAHLWINPIVNDLESVGVCWCALMIDLVAFSYVVDRVSWQASWLKTIPHSSSRICYYKILAFVYSFVLIARAQSIGNYNKIKSYQFFNNLVLLVSRVPSPLLNSISLLFLIIFSIFRFYILIMQIS